MMHNKIHVSSANSKIGKTANISLLPIVTCGEHALCADRCYARKLCYSKTAQNAWLENTAYAINNPWGFIDDLYSWIKKNQPKFFRWHVAGDVPSINYASGMRWLARHCPKTKFLAFTKRYQYDWTDFGVNIPNLIVYWSAWPGMALPDREDMKSKGVRGVAWLEGDERIPPKTTKCEGSCEDCRFCWVGKKDVVLHKH